MRPMNTYTILAAEPAPTDGPQSPLGSPIVMMVLMVVIFYFLIIRPGQRQKKEQAARIAAMQKGDKVVTIGGLHGTIHHISERTVTLKLSEGVFVPFEKSAVQAVNKVRSDSGEKKAKNDEDRASPTSKEQK